MITEHTAFSDTFITATDNIDKSCTLSLYYLLKVSTLHMKTVHVSGSGIQPKITLMKNGC